ncbi:MAG: hypothetical protein ACE5DM_03195 [Candidatus Nanoarchaeia archaeon]
MADYNTIPERRTCSGVGKGSGVRSTSEPGLQGTIEEAEPQCDTCLVSIMPVLDASKPASDRSYRLHYAEEDITHHNMKIVQSFARTELERLAKKSHEDLADAFKSIREFCESDTSIVYR